MILFIGEIDLIEELSHACCCTVFSPVGPQHAGLVIHRSLVEEIADTIKSVIVETVSLQTRLSVIENDMIPCLCHLVITIIIGIVAKELKGVALHHLHMTKGLERVARFIEMGTIAEEFGTLVGEMNLSVEYLGIRIDIYIIFQTVSMNEIDTIILLLHCLYHAKSKQAQSQCDNDSMPAEYLLSKMIEMSSHPYFIQP